MVKKAAFVYEVMAIGPLIDKRPGGNAGALEDNGIREQSSSIPNKNLLLNERLSLYALLCTDGHVVLPCREGLHVKLRLLAVVYLIVT